MQELREAVTSIDQAQKPLLSPFTWNHLSLPPLARRTLTAQVSNKPEKNTNKLATIQETRRKGKQNKQVLKDKLSKSIDYKQQSAKEYTNIASEPSKTIDRPRRYSKPATHTALSKTIQTREQQKQVFPRYEAAISTSEPCKRIKFLDSKHNMEQYLKMSLNKAGWKNGNSLQNQDVKLLWANIDRPTDHLEIGSGQFYNHISGTHHLTTKNGLHQELAQGRYPFFPLSFLIPDNYDSFLLQNTHMAVLAMIRTIGKNILCYIEDEKLNFDWQDRTCLGTILQSSILQTASEQTNLLVKLCMYLQVIRVQKGYIGYFQGLEGYQRVSIKPKPTLFQNLINHAVNYLLPGASPLLQIDYSQIDYRLLVLLLHYHRMFEHYHPTYHHASLWIIKPIASSRGAGISITRSSAQFCLGEDNERVHFKNRKKYENKVIQQYIPNPYLLDKGQFAGRKFDIRQWVLLVSNSNGVNAYRYHTGYCRFASQKYTLSKLDRQIHLTNYSLFKEDQTNIPSVLMLQELFSVSKEDLRSKYTQQSTTIISQVISNCRRLKPQEGCFELLGFDFLLDSNAKLHLLEINLNPACATHRYQPLQAESNKMSETMLQLVTKRRPSSNWVLVAGSQQLIEQQDDLTPITNINVKPFYEYSLGEEQSLIAMIRLRNRTILAINSIVLRYYGKMLIEKLLGKTQDRKQINQVPAKQREDPKEPQGDVGICDLRPNEADIEEGIRFIEQRSTSNAVTEKY